MADNNDKHKRTGPPKLGKYIVQDAVGRAWNLYVKEQFMADLQTIDDPKDRATLMMQYAKFIAPTLRSSDVNFQQGEREASLIDKLKSLSEEQSE